MAKARWNERFLASTRGQIVGLLRRGSRTVNELADAVGLTDNAVRAHLAGLERDGLVEQEGVRRAVGKPAHVYRLTAEAESLFPRAYAFLVGQLVDELRARVGEDGLADALREIGRKAGENAGIVGATAVERLGGLTPLMVDLGAEADVAQEGGEVVIAGHDCPLSAAVASEPHVCSFLEGLIGGATGAPVRQFCEHGDRPRCRFAVKVGQSEAAD